MTWSDVANETGFRIEQASASAGPWTTAGTVAAGVTSFLDTGLLSNTRYYFRVVAAGTLGESAYSTTASTVISHPVANNDAYTDAQYDTLTTNAPGVLANDITTSGDPLTATLVTGVSHGTLTLNPDGSFVYTPTPGYLGMDSFTYAANDGLLSSIVATVTITMPQSIPVATGHGYTVTHGGTLTTSASGTGNTAGVLTNDTNSDGLPLTATLVTSAQHGTLTLNLDGSFVYMPTAGYYGFDSFTYTATGGTQTSNLATVNITVTESAPGGQRRLLRRRLWWDPDRFGGRLGKLGVRAG